MDYEFLLLEFQHHRARTANWFSWDGNGLGLGLFDATRELRPNPETLAFERKMRSDDEHVTWDRDSW